MTHQEIIDRWNTQADRFNQWRELSEDEKLEWAMSLEREACAMVAEEATASWTQHIYNDACMHIAAAIRARGD